MKSSNFKNNSGIRMRTLLCIILLFPFYVYSQDTLYLNLQECIDYAIENSPSAKSARSAYIARTERIKAFDAGFLPQLSFNASIPGLSRQIILVQDTGAVQVYQQQSQYLGYGGLNLSQKIAPLGSEISIFSGISRVDNIFNNQIQTNWRTNPFLLTYRQPIFSYNSMKWESKVQEINEFKNNNEFVSEIENISVLVTNRFFDLYIAEMNLKNAQQNIGVNDTLYTISKGRFEVGNIAENDLLQSELAFLNSKNAFERTMLDYRQAYDEFKISLGIPASKQIKITPPLTVPNVLVNENVALEKALANNPEIKNIELNNLRALMNLKMAESSNGINANLIASFGYNKSARIFESAYKDLLDQQELNLTLEVPIYRWGKGDSEIDAAYEEKRQIEINSELQRKNFEIEVRYQALRFNQLVNQIGIAAKADTIASKRFEVAINRYYIGKIDLNSFFIAQNEKDSAFQSYIQTLKSFWTAYYNIRKLTLYDFLNSKEISDKLIH